MTTARTLVAVAALGALAVTYGCSSDDAAPGATADAGPEDARDAAPEYPCNGHRELCGRRFDEVTFPCTHNAYSAEEYGINRSFRNQTNGLAKQLADGIRCMMLDIYDVPIDAGTEHDLCHVSCGNGKLSHAQALSIIKQFLTDNPHEVLTLDYEDYVTAVDIKADFAAAGLDGLLYVHDAVKGWPTLGEMIDGNHRLVVGIEGITTPADPPPGIHEFYQIAWDTPYSFQETTEFTCAVKRGVPQNALFLLNHWLSTGSLPDKTKAPTANAYDVLYGRAKGCEDTANDTVNFVAVDYYDIGDLFRVVDTLNGF
jgi:hypothetical protein